MTVRQVPWAGRQLDLAADISAPFALPTSQADQIKLRALLLPGSSTNPAQLLFVEPYRPGKIPVVFIHGLLSEPSTWADPVNHLRAVPQVTERFQFWDYRYLTATSFLDSAAALREQLQQAVATVDPLATDPALRQMVLVGHSMARLRQGVFFEPSPWVRRVIFCRHPPWRLVHRLQLHWPVEESLPLSSPSHPP